MYKLYIMLDVLVVAARGSGAFEAYWRSPTRGPRGYDVRIAGYRMYQSGRSLKYHCPTQRRRNSLGGRKSSDRRDARGRDVGQAMAGQDCATGGCELKPFASLPLSPARSKSSPP